LKKQGSLKKTGQSSKDGTVLLRQIRLISLD
jgi:hypothetical protein